MSYPNHLSCDPRNWKRTDLAAQWQVKMGFPDSTFPADAQSFAVDNTTQHTVAHQHESIQCAMPEWAQVHPCPTTAWLGHEGVTTISGATTGNKRVVASVAGDDEGFEGYTLVQINPESRMSALRDDSASVLIPESVKAAGRGQTHRKAISRAPRWTSGRLHPELVLELELSPM
ncbi:hypothetical protein HETIRDRAFT_103832 [Heterobasidion irregulare TC 32-1]|uniref:Uncharacterized protein n=1 Tax=Heterobasidion irregulare (strain TC 32-1) TaxID=747525 RepID=W4K357_HETIT|nr:uncharacterized protein HETIRDRAFT_103832 [Heterobasidion irregulare TC 32-1]ETW79501.1 hypothetical protein HETIRDRAFT_103832 [Heterobasidion irregulare TC 32-1]